MADDPVAELHSALSTCGIINGATRATIIAQEGFTEMSDLGILETDGDVTEMANRMAKRTVNDGRVTLGTVVIKHLQTLVWWIRDRQKRGLPLNAAEFTPEVLKEAAQMKTLRRELPDREPSIADLIRTRRLRCP
jgi:hypothetical protein